MSWLTDIAGKAEDLLNQIDQSAATVLQQSPGSSTKKPRPTQSHLQFLASAEYMTPKEQLGAVAESPVRREHRSSGYASSISSLVSKEQVKEDRLIEYLNESEKARASSMAGLSRRSSNSSLMSLPTQLFRAQEEQDVVGSRSVLEMEGYGNKSQSENRLERELLEGKAKEADLMKALQAKDSQLAVLRVRIQEADHDMHLKSAALDSLKSERQRLLKDSADSTEVRNKALDTLQKQYEQLQVELEQEKRNSKRVEEEYMSRIQRLEEASAKTVGDLTQAQKQLTEEKLKTRDIAEQLRLAKYNLEANKHDFDEYKQKAQRILQSKEKLIEALKQGTGGVEGEQTSLAVELEELRTERDLLKDDLQQAQLHMYNSKAELQELETQLAAEQRAGLEQQRSLQEQCQTFQHSASQYREQLEQLKMEYQYMQDEFRRQQVTLQTKLQEKDAEIVRVMNQSTMRSMNVSSSDELEHRIRHLTENLIQKQTLIEGLQTDKNSLSLQLERLEKMYREAESAAIGASATQVSIGIPEEGSVSSKIPTFLRETPYDTGVTRGVKRAYGTVDTLSVKFGIFLRRYPMARTLVFVYIVLLHLWVMVVLLTYSPEIHPPGYQPPRDKL